MQVKLTNGAARANKNRAAAAEGDSERRRMSDRIALWQGRDQ
jgi:hypothetical protein